VDYFSILFIAFALAIDAFAVALSAGAYLVKADRRQSFRLSFHFGLFQFMMPVIGWAAGSTVAHLIESADHWIAFGLLAVIGGRMIVNSFRAEDERLQVDITRGWSLVSLSVATSIDALAVGLSLAMIEADIIFPSIVIGVVAAGMTLLGLRLGERFSSALGRHMEFAGGVVLILIGVRIVLEHLGHLPSLG
jgi:putative Mn2+ efflux pump MntP